MGGSRWRQPPKDLVLVPSNRGRSGPIKAKKDPQKQNKLHKSTKHQQGGVGDMGGSMWRQPPKDLVLAPSKSR